MFKQPNWRLSTDPKSWIVSKNDGFWNPKSPGSDGFDPFFRPKDSLFILVVFFNPIDVSFHTVFMELSGDVHIHLPGQVTLSFLQARG